jgi:ParB-like chromosome segregation protein Spo0J
MSRNISIEKIVVDPSLYPRSSVNDFTIHRMMAALEVGTQLPPITVEAKTFRLVDGRHRYETHKQKGLKTIDAEEKTYKNEADLFADAVRLNIGHGQPLDTYCVRNAIIRLETYGYTKEAISEVVRLPLEDIGKIERGFANDETGKPIALKGGLSHLAGHTLDQQQREINRRYSGPKAVFFVRQISGLLANDMYPRSQTFMDEMDALCDLWRTIKTKASAA